MYRHDAFIRMPGSQWLPKSCAPILALLDEKPYKVRELAELTGLSVATVRNCAHILESATLAIYHSQGTKLIERSFTNLESALDEFAKSHHADGNFERLKARHVHQRELRDQPRPARTRRHGRRLRVTLPRQG
jgi:hypothetical protein